MTQQDQHQGMQGMADVIQKILAKPKTKAIVSLKKRSNTEFGEEEKQVKKIKKDDEKDKCHILPAVQNDGIKEAMLKRIATRGVVVLFNTVRNHQKTLMEKKKMARTEKEVEKASKSLKKSSFMDMLKTGQKKENEIKEEVKTESSWDVFKDDLMLGSTLKHWDKTDVKSEEVEQPLEDSSSDSED